MEEGINKHHESDYATKDEIFSKAIRAGKRTYFMDVKSTRGEDLYLTITESKKRYNRDGRFYFEKHKIFLYKEDFEKFIDGLHDVMDFIADANDENFNKDTSSISDEQDVPKDYTDVDFDDLESVEAVNRTEEKE